MVRFRHAVWICSLVLQCSLTLSQIRDYTPDCIRGTPEVYMPSSVDGKCHCGALLIDPDGTLVYAKGYCTPYPPDEGLGFRGCIRGGNDAYEDGVRENKWCGFYCECNDKKRDPVNGKLSCCRPTDRFGLQDKTVIAAPAPAADTTSTGTTMTYRMLTTVTTTTEPYYGAQQLLGNIEFSTKIPFLEPPDSFLTDPEVKRGVSMGIALKLGVPNAWVTTDLSIPGRYIQADYQITVPAQTKGNISAWGLTVHIALSGDEIGRHEWSDIIGIGLSKATDEYYIVFVHTVHSPSRIRLDGRGSANGAFRPDITGWSLVASLLLLRVERLL